MKGVVCQSKPRDLDAAEHRRRGALGAGCFWARACTTCFRARCRLPPPSLERRRRQGPRGVVPPETLRGFGRRVLQSEGLWSLGAFGHGRARDASEQAARGGAKKELERAREREGEGGEGERERERGRGMERERERGRVRGRDREREGERVGERVGERERGRSRQGERGRNIKKEREGERERG